MKIALLAEGLHPWKVGGMQKHSYYLAHYLVREGADVYVYYTLPKSKFGPNVPPVIAADGPARLHIRRFERPTSMYFPGHYLVDSYRASSRLYFAMLSGPKVDFVYAQGFAGWKAVKERAKRAHVPPVGVNFHGLNMFQTLPPGRGGLELRMLRPFVKRLLIQSDYAFSLGGRLDTILQDIGVSDDRILQSPNGITADWFSSTNAQRDDRRTFVFVGRYQRLKGIEELNRVLKEIGSGFDFRFLFVGPIPERLHLSEKYVTYLGPITEELALQDVLSRCDVLVCPSYSEGMPTVVLEAMARHAAVIATDVGAVRSMISTESGWLVPPGDVAALRNAMVDAITISRRKLDVKRAKGFQKLRSFLWENVAKTTLSEIERAIGASSRTPFQQEVTTQ